MHSIFESITHIIIINFSLQEIFRHRRELKLKYYCHTSKMQFLFDTLTHAIRTQNIFSSQFNMLMLGDLYVRLNFVRVQCVASVQIENAGKPERTYLT